MHRSDFVTAALLTAVLPVAACNYADYDRSAVDPRFTASAGDAVATSGTLPTGDGLDDAGVTSRIQAKFFLDPGIKGRRIDVDTQGGVVTLRGDVASDNERAQALLLARTTAGVGRVEDALTVNAAIGAPAPADGAASTDAPAPSSADDEALTSLVQSRFGEDASLKASTIVVTAKDGVVLLDGVAPAAAVRQRAVSLARATDGVLQVIDRIAVGKSR